MRDEDANYVRFLRDLAMYVGRHPGDTLFLCHILDQKCRTGPSKQVRHVMPGFLSDADRCNPYGHVARLKRAIKANQELYNRAVLQVDCTDATNADRAAWLHRIADYVAQYRRDPAASEIADLRHNRAFAPVASTPAGGRWPGTTVKAEGGFAPVTVTITLNSQAAFSAVKRLSQLDITVPNVVGKAFDQSWFNQDHRDSAEREVSKFLKQLGIKLDDCTRT